MITSLIATILGMLGGLLPDVMKEVRDSRNAARGVELLSIVVAGSAWSPAQMDEVAALETAWDWIKRVHAASDALEALAPIPADFADDRHWPK